MDDGFYIFLLVMKKNFYMLVTTICSYYKQGNGNQCHWEQKQQRRSGARRPGEGSLKQGSWERRATRKGSFCHIALWKFYS